MYASVGEIGGCCTEVVFPNISQPILENWVSFDAVLQGSDILATVGILHFQTYKYRYLVTRIPSAYAIFYVSFPICPKIFLLECQKYR